jgi:hypothetical protein
MKPVPTDPRLRAPRWSAASPGGRHRLRLRLLALVAAPLALFYFAWLLAPDRMGNPVLYALLVAAELFNLVQAVGFWWTCARERSRAPVALHGAREAPLVDVMVPVYDEPVDVVEPDDRRRRADARRTGARLAARRRRQRRHARAGRPPGRRLHAPAPPPRRQGGQPQSRPAPLRRAVRGRARL